MRSFVVLAVMAIVVLAGSDSQAANRRVRTSTAPAGNGYVSENPQPSPVGRLMDLERRKNAALRQMFFGR